jgi:uncharacterized cupredoxin-like copper-binding protein
MRTRHLLIPLALAAMLVVAACGDSADETPPPPAQPPSDVIRVAATEFAYTPDSWVVPAGQEVEITFDNEGTIVHEWVIVDEPIDSEDEFRESSVLFRVQTDGGTEKTDTFIAPRAGAYQIVCAIPGHFSAGMKGDLATVAP